MLTLQAILVLACILIGARYSGIALGLAGILGLAILVFVFGCKPASAPINVVFIIMAITCLAASMQAAGGLDYMVNIAERILRKHPKHITFLAPTVCFVSVMLTGTSYVAMALYPVICEVALEAKIRVERPLSIAVIASQHAISASPVSAATAALIAVLAVKGVSLGQIMLVLIPGIFVGCMIGAFSVLKRGKELEDDPEFQRRLREGELETTAPKTATYVPTKTAKLSVWLFLVAVVMIVTLGSFPSLLPSWEAGGKVTRLSIPVVIQFFGFGFSFLMIAICRIKPDSVIKASVFGAGMVGVIATFGIAWMADTFFAAHSTEFIGAIGELVQEFPALFCLMVFTLAILLQSQGATTQTIMPIGMALGLPVSAIVGAAPAVNSIFFLPCSGSMIAGMMFDRSGTTKIGRWIVDHSFMFPGLVSNICSIAICWFFASMIF